MERKTGAQRKPRGVLFFIVTACFWFANYAYMPTFTPYLSKIGIGYAAIGTISGAYGLAQLLIRLPLGIVSDRIGKRKIFVIAGAFFAMASSFLLAVTTAAWAIWLWRFVSGMAASCWVVYTVLFASYYEDEKTASRISLLSLANTGGILVAKMSGSIAVQYFGEKAAFVLSGAVGLLGLVLSLFVTENVPAAPSRSSTGALMQGIKNRNLVVMSFLALLLQMSMFATINTFTPEVAAKLGADSVQLGILATLSSIPGIFVSMLLGWLFARRVNFKRLIAVAFALSTAGCVVTAYGSRVETVYVGGLLAGFGFGICMTALLSNCTLTVAPEFRSIAMGFYQGVYSIGMFIGPVIVGVFVDRFSLQAGILAAGGIGVLGMVLALVLLPSQVSTQKL